MRQWDVSILGRRRTRIIEEGWAYETLTDNDVREILGLDETVEVTRQHVREAIDGHELEYEEFEEQDRSSDIPEQIDVNIEEREIRNIITTTPTTANELIVQLVQQPADPGEPQPYGQILEAPDIMASNYRHSSACPCAACEANDEWSKLPTKTVRTSRKKGIIPASEWLTGSPRRRSDDED